VRDWDPCSGEPLEATAPSEAPAFLERLLTAGPCDDHGREIHRLGLVVDISDRLGRGDGIALALVQGQNRLTDPSLEPVDAAVLHYFMSNAWETRRRLDRSDWDMYAWEQPELERQMVHLRQAVRLGRSSGLEMARLCEMYTNLGNLLNHCGRVVEAVAAWDEALALDSSFMMALGNRGYGLFSYAQISHDPGHRVLLFQAAYRGVLAALAADEPAGYEEARTTFEWVRDEIEANVPQEALSRKFNFKPPREWSSDERSYREWALRHRLFLNDLNDLDVGEVTAADVLTLPTITTSLEAPQPSVLGFLNQLKQEFVTARYLYYRGTRGDDAHFSDRDVTMVNTLDYPTYGIQIEMVRLAFRTAYSLFDKIAYFLNDYMSLGIPERGVAFRSFWYVEGKPKKGLRPEFGDPRNRGLKGLFWLGKDLYEADPEFSEAIEPDAREIAVIRNHIEHKYLKVHESGPPAPSSSGIGFEVLAFSLARDEFERRTLKILKLARAALLYLVQGVYVEEALSRSGDGDRIAAPMYLDTWDDDWKF
jgi:tetratricopeptide (TPR) repeat protein